MAQGVRNGTEPATGRGHGAGRSAVAHATMDELDAVVGRGGIQAVCLPRTPEPAGWERELDAAIASGAFALPRTELAPVDADDVATWLDRTAPAGAVASDTRNAVLSDIVSLVHLAEAVTGASSFQVRILTEAPDRRCGFHLDTVGPGAPTWGVLRVYNGEGTQWVEPADVISMASFYRWLHERDRLGREHAGSPATREALLARHDAALPFLSPGGCPQVVPSRTTVVFRQLDAQHHWSDHASDLAWLHSSPMTGRRRLVVNVSAAHRS